MSANKIPAISVRQPWLYAMFELGKTVENRSWTTQYRGPILLHASKTIRQRDILDVRAIAGPRRYVPDFDKTLDPMSDKNPYQRGGIVGRAVVVGCVNEHPSLWFFGRFGWALEKIERVRFIPCHGKLGLFTPDIEAEQVVPLNAKVAA